MTVIDSYSKVAFAMPFFDEHGIPLSRILTDHGTEFCGVPEPASL